MNVYYKKMKQQYNIYENMEDNKMENIIRVELKKRIRDNDTLFAIIGPEIKLRRSLLNKTLKFIAFKICSISYVSKLESNEIKPNRVFLSEIGKRVNMTEEEIDGLFCLREVLNKSIKEFLFNDNTTVKKILEEKKNYVNYRYRLLVFLNSIYENDLITAEETYLELLKISKSMTDYDFKIFALLSSIYLYKSGEIIEAFDNLTLLAEAEISNDLKYLLELYLFYCLNSLCKPETVIYYQKTRENLIYIGAYELLDEINYYLAIYFIKNGSPDFSMSLLDTIRDPKRKHTIELLTAFISDQPIKHFKKKDLLAPALCVYDYMHDKASLAKDVEEASKKYFKIDFYPIIFKYLTIDNYIEKYNFIAEQVLPIFSKSDDLFLKRYFMKEAVKISEKTAKYKLLYELMNSYYKGACF